MKIVKYFEKSGLLIKRVSKIIENETKEQKGRFKGVIQASEEKNTAGQDFSSCLVL